jgi:hypothetical protein
LGVEHGFRLATEADTRSSLKGPFLNDWGNAIGNMHGWTDGDPWVVNYVGHPMEGVVANYIWINNDPEYKDVRFGKSRRYWISRLRSAAFGFVYSAEFEIGPISEASIGNVQSKYPAQGFVDWVITPGLGFGLVLLQDALDRYVVEKFEDRYQNAVARALLRSFIVPSRTLANTVGFRQPWARDNRAGVRAYRAGDPSLRYIDKPDEPLVASDRPWTIPSRVDFDFQATSGLLNGRCIGASGTMLYNLAPSWSLVFDGGGCKLQNMPENLSGDLLFGTGGIRYTIPTNSRLQPYIQIRAGVAKLYQREVLPDRRVALERIFGSREKIPNDTYPLWAIDYDSTAPAISVGGGLKLGLTRAFSLRLAGIDYTRTGLATLNGRPAANNLQISSGFELRLGNW